MPEKLAKAVPVPITELSAAGIPLRARRIALVVVPVALFILSFVMVNAQGPWGANNRSDPEYDYLLNSLSLLTFHIPGHVDHPGTTLQEFGAAILFCKWITASLTGGWTSISRAVLSQPDDYLRAINLGIDVVLCGAVFLAGLRLYVASRSMPAALLLQFTLLLFRQTLLALPRISPEPFLITAGSVLMIPLISVLLGQNRKPDRTAASAGAIFGFGMITKVTFLPLAAVALLAGGRKDRNRFAFGALAMGLIVALPILPRLPKVVHWLTLNLIHTGEYGTGPVGMPASSAWLVNLKTLVNDEPFLFCCLVYYALILLAMAFANRDPFTLVVRRLVWIVCGIIGLQLAMTLRHPQVRYMLPAMVICALPNAFIFLWLTSSALTVAFRWSLATLGVLLMAAGLWSSQWAVAGWIREAKANQAAVRTLAAVRRAASGCITIGYYKSSSPGYALAYGDDSAHGVQGKLLEELYPDLIFYDKFAGEFRAFAFEPRIVQVRQLLREGRCVLLEGEPSSKTPFPLAPEFSIELIAQEGDQAIYRLHPGPPR